MKKYSVEVVRTSYSSKTFEIWADNADDARKEAGDMALDHDFSGEEYDCEYQVLQPEEIPNDYIDREGNPYDADDDEHCWPAGGGLHKDCEFNADALYAYYVVKDRDKIFDYLTNKCFRLVDCHRDFEVWAKGNTKIFFECYDFGAGLWGYMHTELIGK